MPGSEVLCAGVGTSSHSLWAGSGQWQSVPWAWGTTPGGAGAHSGRTHTCCDNTIHVSRLVFLAKKVRSGCFQLFVIAGHHCHMVDLVGGHMLHRETWKCGVTA